MPPRSLTTKKSRIRSRTLRYGKAYRPEGKSEPSVPPRSLTTKKSRIRSRTLRYGKAYRPEGQSDPSVPPRSLTTTILESTAEPRSGRPTDWRVRVTCPSPHSHSTEYKFPAIPSVKYQGHRREALTMGAPLQRRTGTFTRCWR